MTTKGKTALLVLFNHRYDKNLAKLDAIYREKFENVYYLVPFYDGERRDVIPVYGHSYHFATYLSQAYTHLRGEGYTHYFVVADDMVINPRVNQETLWDEMGLEKDECYMPRVTPFAQRDHFWCRGVEALQFNPRQKGLEIERILPPKAEAERLFDSHGVEHGSVPLRAILPRNILSAPFVKYFGKFATVGFRRKTRYPLAGGYCDILLITEEVMPTFCQYCGALSSAGLFVEIAIPTALLLTAKKLRTNDDVKLKSGDVWTDREKEEIHSRYGGRVSRLLAEYPSDKLYLHPVKLSQWQIE